jgi:hypothetical protein
MGFPTVADAIAALDLAPSLITPLIDFTVAGTTTFAPSHAGFLYMATQVFGIMSVCTGALTAGFICKAGNNAGHDNIIAQQAASVWTTGQQTACITEVGVPIKFSPGVIYSAGAHPFAGGVLLDLSAPIIFQITTPASGTGGFSLKGKVVMVGALVTP